MFFLYLPQEHSHDKVQVENSAIGGPAFVQ